MSAIFHSLLRLAIVRQSIRLKQEKRAPGAHASGRAVDIGVRGDRALKVIEVALKHGMTGIGVNQKGGSRFIHLDDLEASGKFHRPTIWSY